MHNNGGCTDNGLDIEGTRCDQGPCKIGNWAEQTSGLTDLVCECPGEDGAHYSAWFPQRAVLVGDSQCQDWRTFRESLNGTYDRITIRGTEDPVGVTCSGPAATSLCAAMRDGGELTTECDGRTWVAGGCGDEISAGSERTCQCKENAHTVRPCLGNQNWGGAGTGTCGAAAQTLEVICE